MFQCIASNSNGIKCKFIPVNKDSEYCGFHKNKEYYDKMVEKRENKTKIYYKKNKDMLSEKNKIYYQKNKERYLEKFNCVCGSTCCFKSIYRHNKSIKHKNYINSITCEVSPVTLITCN